MILLFCAPERDKGVLAKQIRSFVYTGMVIANVVDRKITTTLRACTDVQLSVSG